MCTQGFRCGPQATNWVTHTPRRFGLVFPGSRATDPGEHFSPALVLCAWGAGSLIRVRAHPGFQLWAPSPLIWVRTNRGSGVCWGCLSCVHSQGAEGVGAQGHGCCGEFSNKPLSASIFSFSFLKNSSYSSPPGPNKHLAFHTAQPGSLPRILQQTLHPCWGLQAPWSPRLSQGPYCP